MGQAFDGATAAASRPDAPSIDMDAELLVLTYADIDDDARDAFVSWQEQEQLPRLRGCPGVLEASWLDSVEGQPGYMLQVAVQDRAVAGSAAVKAALDWAPWVRELRGWHRRTYRRIFLMAVDEVDAAVSPFVLAVRSDVTPDAVEAFNSWYDDVHVPEVLGCPGFLSAARYVCIDGEPQFLALYDLDRSDALVTPEMERIYGFGPMVSAMRGEHGRLYQCRAR